MKKICNKCLIEKNENDFTKDASSKDGYYCMCRLCKRTITNLRRTENSVVKQKSNQYNKERRHARRHVINAIKTSFGCMKCSENTHPGVLEFHHLDNMSKEMDVSTSKMIGIDRLVNEITKCVCLCANCHRKVHMNVLNISDITTITIEQINKVMINSGLELI